MMMPMSDSGIDDQTCFELKRLKCGVVCYFQGRIFNPTNLLNHVEPSVELTKLQLGQASVSSYTHLTYL